MEDYKKKYEQALENIKKIKVANKSNKELVDFIEYKYPELKESEDERIKEALIEDFKNYSSSFSKFGGISDDDIFAWLEKQGKLKDKLVKYREWLISKTEQWTEKEKDKTNSNAGKHYCIGAANTLISARAKFEEIFDYEYWLEKQGEQKPTDKIEPKFKVGDWVTNGIDFTFKVMSIKDDMYYRDDNYFIDIKTADKTFRLWTIQDAKDGDVLTTKDAVFIFKHMDVAGLSLCDSYCDVIGNSNLGFGFAFPIQTVRPATKEQRDLLSTKMKEAGYEWDGEKKELRKIEQKPTDKVVPKFKVGDVIRLKGCAAEYTIGSVTSTTYYTDGWSYDIEGCEEDYELVEQKSTWSEEDEKMYQSIMDDTVQENQLNGKQTDWLRDIKYRHFSQPQNTWKPSDEQIEALLKLEEMHVLEHEKNQENAHLYMVVKSIRKQLLKLKGE